jgi:hypothetical protein
MFGVPTHAERIIEALTASSGPLDDDQLAARLSIDRHTINAVCRKLELEGRLQRSKVVGGKIVNILKRQPLISPQRRESVPSPSVGVGSGREFEEHARRVLTDMWGQPLASRILTLDGGVTHSFDFVSPDGTVVGDAKWYKDLQPIPAAKLSVIAEYVWLLGHVQGASRRFIVFGQDRAVPLRWLKRFAPLLDGIEFWFLEGSELERLA